MLDFRKSSINSALRKVLKRFHYPLEELGLNQSVIQPMAQKLIGEHFYAHGSMIE
jgi:hypothetical protein